jgi:recombinational DNA repair protein (RecF pathway)
MNKFSRDEYIIIRISDYKDNKSIVNAIGRRSGLVSFAVRKHKSFKSPFAGKISKLNIINAELFESNNHNYLNNINKTYHIGQIDNIKEYQSQQKLLLILEN